MSFRDGIIFKISSPHTEKIYIGCSSLPLNRAVSGLCASAKFRKLSCNILFQAGDIQSEILEKFQDITVLEMRKKLGAKLGLFPLGEPTSLKASSPPTKKMKNEKRV